MRRVPRAVVLIFSLLTPAVAAAQGVGIQHDPVGCVVAERFPQFEARVVPIDRVSRVRLYFRPEGGRHWYSVAMTREGELFLGVMPKPRRSLKSFSYYIEATDVDFMASRTEEHAPQVVAGAAACQQQLLAATVPSASVVVEAPAGAPAVPAGFSVSGVTTAGVAGAAGVGAGAGTGVSTGLVLGIVGGAAAAAGVAVAVGGGGGSTTPTTQPPSMTTPTTTTTMPPPPQPDLTGQWTGTSPDGSTQTAGRCAGQQDDSFATLSQSGSSLSGTITFRVRVAAPDPTCDPVGFQGTGTLAGTVGSGAVSFTITYAPDANFACTGTYTNNRASGTWLRSDPGHNGAGVWSINRQ